MNSPALPYIITTASGAQVAVAAIERLEQGAAESNGEYRRRCERSAWHSLARTLLCDATAQFSYNDLGAPLIVGSELFIGVSHSSSLVAVIVSPRPCAVDIESLDRNFSRVESRYITPHEATLSSSPNLPAQLWSIKETLYKYAGRRELSLLHDLRVESLLGCSFTATIVPHTTRIHGNVVVAWGHALAYID